MPGQRCIPIYVVHAARLSFAACKVMEGVSLVPYSGGLKRVVDELNATLPQQPGFGATHAILIDESRYEAGVRQRLARESTKLPSRASFIIDDEAIGTEIGVAMLIAGGVPLVFGGSYSLVNARGHVSRRLRTTGYAHRATFRVHGHALAALSALSMRKVSSRRFRRIVTSIDRYYRSGLFWTDRIAIGLRNLFTASTTPYVDQTFIGLMTILEALFATGPTEVTHTLGERTALVVGKTKQERSDIYTQLKHLYNVRSKLVHGRSHLKRTAQMTESLGTTATFARVPHADLVSLYRIGIAALWAVLADDAYLNCSRTIGNEETIGRALDTLFLTRLLA